MHTLWKILTLVLRLGATAFLATMEFWKDVIGGYHWSMPLVAILAYVVGAGVDVLQDRQKSALASERQKFTIRRLVGPEYDRLRVHDKSARLNIMLVLPLCESQRLFSRWPWHKRLGYFERIGFRDHDHDLNMLIKEKDGVAGTALHYEQSAIGLRGENVILVGGLDGPVARCQDVDINLDQARRDKVAKLRIIFSYPIRRLRRDGVDVAVAGPVIGVINVDSEMMWEEWRKGIDPKDFVDVRLPAMAHAVAFALA